MIYMSFLDNSHLCESMRPVGFSLNSSHIHTVYLRHLGIHETHQKEKKIVMIKSLSFKYRIHTYV